MVETMNTQDLRIARQSTDTPEDAAIRTKLKSLLYTDRARSMVNGMRKKMEDFFAYSLDPKHKDIDYAYKDLLTELKKVSDPKIASGEENIDRIRKEKGVIIVTNHLGLGILTIIDNSDKKYPTELKEFAGFPVRLSALSLLAEKLQMRLAEAAIELPEPFLSLQRKTPTILIPISGERRTEKLIDGVSDVLKMGKSMIVMYPEGGTSGKRNNSGPYNLDYFHHGAFVAASRLSIPILPVCQVINPERGIDLYVLPLVEIGKTATSEELSKIMEKTKEDMQNELNSKTRRFYPHK